MFGLFDGWYPFEWVHWGLKSPYISIWFFRIRAHPFRFYSEKPIVMFYMRVLQTKAHTHMHTAYGVCDELWDRPSLCTAMYTNITSINSTHHSSASQCVWVYPKLFWNLFGLVYIGSTSPIDRIKRRNYNSTVIYAFIFLGLAPHSSGFPAPHNKPFTNKSPVLWLSFGSDVYPV